jgi:hypothetical protein
VRVRDNVGISLLYCYSREEIVKVVGSGGYLSGVIDI